MTGEFANAGPPRFAVWLVDLFTPASHAESVLGDLYEEFFDLAARSGVAAARRWFWRQSRKTVANLVAAQLVALPWSVTAAVLLGFLLRRFCIRVPEAIIVAILRSQRPYSNLHYHFYIWLVTWGFPIVRIAEFLLVGCIVAAIAKGREMLATTTLSLVSAVFVAALFSVALPKFPPEATVPWPLLVANVEDWMAIVLGGILVRTMRSLRTHSFSKP